MSEEQLREAYDLKCEVYDNLLRDYQTQKEKLRTYEDALTATLGNALEFDNDYITDVLIDVLIDGAESEMLPEFKRKYWAEGATVLAQYMEDVDSI